MHVFGVNRKPGIIIVTDRGHSPKFKTLPDACLRVPVSEM